MNRSRFFATLFTLVLLAVGSLQAQQQSDPGYQSISEAELRSHIFFLASDYMNGRVSTTPEYAIASQYVASQFAAAGLKPMVIIEGSEATYFQGLPFARTTFNDKLLWTVIRKGAETELVHKTDFKILVGNPLNCEKLPLVYVGYGIDEPTSDWTDYKGLDLKGKIAVCLAGAPMKDGQPVLPKAVNDKYTSRRSYYTKGFVAMTNQGAAGLIMVDPDGSSGMVFDQTNSSFTPDKTSYLGGQSSNRMGMRPSVYLVKPEFLDLVMSGMKNNPNGVKDILKNYKPQELKDTYLKSPVDIIRQDTLYSNNVIGIVPGTDPLLRDEYIVVGGHLDHVPPQQGKVCNGADDNASGSAGVMEIAGAVAMNPCKRTVVFVAWSGEEMGLLGSAFFLGSGLIPKEKIKFNLNLDMIGRTGKGNEPTRAHYVVTNKKYLQGLTTFINEVNTGVTDFPILFNDDAHSPGGSDHMSFMGAGIPAFFFFSGVHADLHNPGDDPEKIDYPKAASICRLGYLIVEKLGNVAIVPGFE
ncbi:MAG: M20/M25/M40 family metallo-hydrolase [Bacteroidales bacterium]|jgi:hypothetical protein